MLITWYDCGGLDLGGGYTTYDNPCSLNKA